jgi:hypothetical protein
VGPHADRSLGIAIAGDGSTLMLTTESLSIGSSTNDAWLSRWDAAGELVYSRPVGDVHVPSGRALALVGGDALVLTIDAEYDETSMARLLRFEIVGGDPLDSIDWDARGRVHPTELRALPDGSLAIGGTTQGLVAEADRLPESGGTRTFVASVDPTGRTKWVSGIVGDTGDAPMHLAMFEDTSVAVAGSCLAGVVRAIGRSPDAGFRCGDAGGYVARWGADGKLAWMRRLGAISMDATSGVTPRAVAARGAETVVVGSFSGVLDIGAERLTSVGSSDGFVAHWDAKGELLGAWAVGDAGLDRFNDVAVDSHGDLWIAATMYGEQSVAIDLGRKRVRSSEDTSDWPRFGAIVRVDPDRRAGASLPLRRTAAPRPGSSAADGATPRLLAIGHGQVRVVGEYGDAVDLPILDGTHVRLELRDPDGIDDELFLWAAALE